MKCIYNGWTHNELWNFKTLHQKSLKQLNGGARRTIDLQGRRSFEHQRHWVSRRRRNRSPNRRKRNRRRRPMSAMTCSQTFPPDTRSTTSCGVELCAAGGIQDCQMGYGCTQTSAYHVPVLLGHMILWALLRWDNPMRRWIAFSWSNWSNWHSFAWQPESDSGSLACALAVACDESLTNTRSGHSWRGWGNLFRTRW